MRGKWRRFLWTAAVAGLLSWQTERETAADASGQSPQRGMVATVHPQATQAGLDALRGGGNAVDAAVAAALTLGVVDSHNSGIGGGCFILIRCPDGKIIAIDGREMAPRKAHRDMYLRDGRPQHALSKTGALASGVPGALAAYHAALSTAGTQKLTMLLLPAAEIAEQGFAIDRSFASRLSATASKIAQFEATRKVFLRADGTPFAAGQILKQPDLANTYRAIAANGVAWFYDGPFAQATERWMREHGGIITAEDFAAYRPVFRQPVVSKYRGTQIVGFPPPSSGGVHVAQILNILEPFDLQRLHREDPARLVHVVAEAMKLAFADRAHWLGDADFVPVPRGLTAADYGQSLAARIDPNAAMAVEKHSVPPNAETELFRKHTTHIAAADAEGYWVAITATVNTSFGSKVMVPGTGVVLNNQMDDFSIAPGVPNAFGLIGGEANAIAPGKRPLSSMSPTIVLRDGQPILTVGAAGGPKIITQVVLAVIHHLDLNMPIEQALAAPRFHHQWRPDVLFIEDTFAEDTEEQLREFGHDVRRIKSVGVTQAITLTNSGHFRGAHDPRVSGQAAGF